MRRAARGRGAIALALLTIGILAGVPDRPVHPTPTDPPAVEAVVGSGLWTRALCLGCAATFVGAGGMTIAGTLFVMGWMLEGTVGCLAVCTSAF